MNNDNRVAVESILNNKDNVDDAINILSSLRLSPKKIFTNPFNESVYLKKIKGGLTECCLADNPCEDHLITN